MTVVPRRGDRVSPLAGAPAAGRRACWAVVTALALLASAAPLRARAATPQLLPARQVQVLAAPSPQPFDQPTDVVADAQGFRYVLDGVNDRIVVFDRAGQYLRAFGQGGKAPGGLRRPVGIGLDPRSRTLLVADTGNGRITTFTVDGTPGPLFALPAGERPAGPTDVIVAAGGLRLVVVDNDNHLLRILDRATGRLLTTTGGFGETAGKLRHPATVAEGPDGGLYVVDVLGGRVIRYNPDGQQPRQISGWGTEPGTLFRPKGVAVDRLGRVFVSDSLFGIVQVFDATGKALGVLAASGKPLRLAAPTSLTLDDRERLHVVETRANRVIVLEVRLP
ncbi:MAG: NHL repeat-containing protein [Myxococcota bacterium]|nr:NHL repeat-containing protein [Myxococcota bacterium]